MVSQETGFLAQSCDDNIVSNRSEHNPLTHCAPALVLHCWTCTQNPLFAAAPFRKQKSHPQSTGGSPFRGGLSIAVGVCSPGRAAARPRWQLEVPTSSWHLTLTSPPPSEPSTTAQPITDLLPWAAQAYLAQLCAPQGMMLSCSPFSEPRPPKLSSSDPQTAPSNRSLCGHSLLNPCGPGKK